MKIKLVDSLQPETMEMRTAFCTTMLNLAEENDKVLMLDADLIGAMGTKSFQQKYPDRVIDCGIQESNMIGVAAGLSAVGYIPFTHTFGPFATRRACDQIFMSGAYAKQNIKVIGSDPGITAELNGGTHMPFEDLGIMRGIPGMTVVEPTDCIMLSQIIKKAASDYGMYYIRLVRKMVTKVYEADSEFEIGKAIQLLDGADLTIIACGICVEEALKAAKSLEKEGIYARVLDMFTIKPVDREAIIKAANETGAVVTIENHSINNGLGSAVAEVLAEESPVPMVRLGVRDEFGEVGPRTYLKERFGMTAEAVIKGAHQVLVKKLK